MRKYLFMLPLLMLCSLSAFAQYDIVLDVQDTMEQRVYSNNRIQMERIIWKSDTGLVMHKGRLFNTRGQLMMSREYYSRLFLNYDPRGMLINYLDSSFNDDSFEVISYTFNYDQMGRIVNVVTHDGRSTIQYSKDGRNGVETFITTAKDTSKRYYTYDAQRRLVLSDFYDSDGNLYFRERNIYNDEGKLATQHIVKYLENNGLDSTIYVFKYKDGRLSEKGSNVTKLYYISEDGGSNPTHSALQEYAETTKYFYNKKGQLLGREYTHSKNDLVYTYFSWTYNEKGLVTEHSEKYGLAEPLFFTHEYSYY